MTAAFLILSTSHLQNRFIPRYVVEGAKLGRVEPKLSRREHYAVIVPNHQPNWIWLKNSSFINYDEAVFAKKLTHVPLDRLRTVLPSDLPLDLYLNEPREMVKESYLSLISPVNHSF
jgi:hypothetical protein